MNKKVVVGVAAVVVVALVLGAYFLWPRGGGESQTVRIAANLPLSGDLAIFGAAVRDGGIMAVEDLEKADPSGPKLKFDWQDNAGSPTTTVSIMQKQYLQPPDIYISGVKPQTMAIIDQVNAKGTPHFLWIFDAFINKNAPKKNNFRTWVSYKIEPAKYFEYIDKRKPQRVAILYVNLPHAEEEFNTLVIPRLKDRGIEVYAEAYDLGIQDYRTLALKVRDFNPDLIILNGFPHTLTGIVRALRPLGLIKDGNTIGTYDMIDVGTILGPDELEGIRVIAPAYVTQVDTPKVRQWRERFKEKYNKEPWYTIAFAYDMVQIIHDAAKRLKLPATSEQWIEALLATNIDGITGPLKFDKEGDLITPLQILVYRNGKLVPEE
jgi:branched-chain amino acid transport system substrate-binding protein